MAQFRVLRTIEEIRDRIVDVLDPESVILFGSRARGGTTESDVDLVIARKTDSRPIDRRIEAERALADRAVPIDIFVYTPAEMLRLYEAGSPFIEEVVETGRVLYMRKATEVWLREAEEELDSARILHDHGMHRGACFHGQQCVEKCLKALIIEAGGRPDRTQDLLALKSRAESLGGAIDLTIDEAVFLNSAYKGRYPSEEGLLPHGEPSTEDGEKAVRAAAAAFRSVGRALDAAGES